MIGAAVALPEPSSAWGLASRPPQPSGERAGVLKEKELLMSVSHQGKRIRVQIFLEPIISAGALGIWAFLAWPGLDPQARGRKGMWETGNESTLRMMRIIISVVTLTGRLREWNQACAHHHQAGMTSW